MKRGSSGFWLYDELTAYGAECIVTPPSLIPMEYGNRVKTDRRDSRKLSLLLRNGMIKGVWVPDIEARGHRTVARRRRQLIKDRVRTQLRIKAELMFCGISMSEPKGKWSKTFVRNLRAIKFHDRWIRESFNRLVDEMEYLNNLIEQQTALLKELSETDRYREQAALLKTIPGFGLVTIMELLLELGDVSRFKRGSQLAAYVGLTPSQYSSGEHVRMGRITGIGKSSLRATLVEASWRLIAGDAVMGSDYRKLKIRSGGKRAIVAMTRKILLKVRRMLLDNTRYKEHLLQQMEPQTI